MPYDQLVSNFIADDVYRHSSDLDLHNPHHDDCLKPSFAKHKKKLDWLHEPNSDEIVTVQFIGSHYSNLDWLRKYYSSKTWIADESKANESKWQPFDGRFVRVGITPKYRLGNCALGYIPNLPRTTGYFRSDQIEYLRPRKMREYCVSGTKAVFTLGGPALDFHLHDTVHRFSSVSDAIDNGPLRIDHGLIVIPLPHPGRQGIAAYMRARQCVDRTKGAQDECFRRLVNNGFHHLRHIVEQDHIKELPPLKKW